MPSSADPFEDQLAALFAAPPEAPDAEDFALRAEQLIAVESKRRAFVYGVCAAAAGVSAVAIVAAAGAFRGLGRAVDAMTGLDFSWASQAGPVAGGMLLVLIIAELSSSAQRR